MSNMSTANLTLANLQKLLREEEEEFRGGTAKAADVDYGDLKAAIDRVWDHMGGGRLQQHSAENTDIKPRWIRPMSDMLYRCPLSTSQTTLVPWKSLPAAIQAKLIASGYVLPPGVVVAGGEPNHDSSPGIVEVPLSYLDGDNAELNGVKVRSIQGNLSDKLSQYTRGLEGQRNRPFRPGGLEGVDDKKANANNTENEDEYRTSEMIERSRRVLDRETVASWNDGSLLTAPPGMPFRVGLTWEDVHGTDSTISDFAARRDDIVANPQESGTYHTGYLHTTNEVSTVSPGIFTRNYFDDDSLFGSSSSDSEDKSEASASNERDSLPETEAPEGNESADPITRYEPPSVIDGLLAETDMDVDQLLVDLAVTEEKHFGRKPREGGTMPNPLELAEKQARKEASRKSWASEELLQIDDFNTLIPNPALTYPFTLDDFQQQAVARLERSESVFVAAHTSAGKTVVAEYAIALAKQRATRCIYTSPIKALSNQKFRDFCLKFGSENVGLVTGDLQVNVENSTCLIMTTEILRSMLYRGADLIRDIEFVVFDEVHYVNDTERGVVWEEVIVLLPSNVNMIFLSATTPNSFEFSDWIGRTKQRVVHVIKTDYRPVPLSHFLWAGTKLHKVLQGNGSFLEQGYTEASRALLPASATDPTKKKSEQKGRPVMGSKDLAWQAQGNKQNWVSLVRFLDSELLTPTVVFSFSKKKCEELSYSLISLDLNTAKEASAVQGFTLQAVGRLSRNDAQLPQVLSICEMVKRGIGIHHGGLLPILKEMVEILFSKNLIKVLFATETFAMGVNMPAKAVIFNSIRKHDGNQFRVLEPGEYTQMAGRAGRRGLDKVGTVIICCFGEMPPPQAILRQMLTGTSTRLSSNFRLTYGMILNLLKSEAELSVEAMIKRSFSEFATQRALTANEYPQLLARGVRTLQRLEEQYRNDSASWIGAEDLDEYFRVCNELLSKTSNLLTQLREFDSASFGDIFQPGRLILITAARSHGVVRAPAIVLRTPPSSAGLGSGSKSNADAFICILLMPSSFLVDSTNDMSAPFGCVGHIGRARQRHYSIQEIGLDQVLLVSGKKYKVDIRAIYNDTESLHDMHTLGINRHPMGGVTDPFAGMKSFGKTNRENAPNPASVKKDAVVEQVVSLLMEAEGAELRESGVDELPLRNFFKRGNDVVEYRKYSDQISHLLVDMRSFASHRHPNLEKYYRSIERKQALQSKVDTLRHLLSNESLHLFPDFLQRKAVLLHLGYIEENETVCIKGRVACEVNTCDELLLTEMVFEGILNELEPPELIAVLSSLVWQEKSRDDDFDTELPAKLVQCCNQMKVIAVNLGQLQKERGLPIDPGEYCESTLRFGLVHVVYEWALGVSFKSICELTDAHEGSIVRCITRLDELCREVRNIARVLGNPSLYKTAEASSVCIKRDIVFASSLYVS